MTYPAYDTSHLADAGSFRGGPITCSACGCRVACADAAHDSRGRAAAA